jgi:uncharacterized membrane protein
MTVTRSTIVVDQPVRTVYDQWTHFEEFPRFMGGVDDVRQLDDTHLHWTARIGGVRREWNAQITRQEPDRAVAWQSTSGARNDGLVQFVPEGPSTTRVDLVLEFEPDGLIEKAGDRMGVVERQAAKDLERFSDFIEQRDMATGAWRGRVEDGEATAPQSPSQPPLA